MKFPYRRYEVRPTPAQPEATVLHRPVIPFRLTGPSASVEYYGLLDTGADESYITQEMAELLDVTPDSTDIYTVESASGDMPVQYGRATIAVEQGSERYSWDAVVGIVPEPWPEAILGHVGCLQYFEAIYSYEHCVVELLRNQCPFVPLAIH